MASSASTILLNVSAYVDVASASKRVAVTNTLAALGARICRVFIEGVTHVIFEDGKQQTLDRAIARSKCVVVSPQWVSNCQTHQKRCDETKYPIKSSGSEDVSEVESQQEVQAVAESVPVFIEETQFQFDNSDSEVPASPPQGKRVRDTTPLQSPARSVIPATVIRPTSSSVSPLKSPAPAAPSLTDDDLEFLKGASRPVVTYGSKPRNMSPTPTSSPPRSPRKSAPVREVDDDLVPETLALDAFADRESEDDEPTLNKGDQAKKAKDAKQSKEAKPTATKTSAVSALKSNGKAAHVPSPLRKQQDTSKPEEVVSGTKTAKSSYNTTATVDDAAEEPVQQIKPKDKDAPKGKAKATEKTTAKAAKKAAKDVTDDEADADDEQPAAKVATAKSVKPAPEATPATAAKATRTLGKKTAARLEPEEAVEPADEDKMDVSVPVQQSNAAAHSKTSQKKKQESKSDEKAVIEKKNTAETKAASKAAAKTASKIAPELIEDLSSEDDEVAPPPAPKRKAGKKADDDASHAETNTLKQLALSKDSKPASDGDKPKRGVAVKDQAKQTSDAPKSKDKSKEKSKEKSAKTTKKKSSKHSDASDVESEHEVEVEVEVDDEEEEQTKPVKRKATSQATRDSEKTSKGSSKANPSNGKKAKKAVSSFLMLSGLSDSERDIVISTVEHLGGFELTKTFDDNVTHIVSGGARTLKVLSGISHGCWILSPEWVMKSLEVGQWLEEEPYELHAKFPAAQHNRLARSVAGTAFKQTLFKGKSVFIADGTQPERSKLEELFETCGGKVVDNMQQAYAVVSGARIDGFKGSVVTEKWMIDSICEHKVLPLKQFIVAI